jgi:hypothetical protein
MKGHYRGEEGKDGAGSPDKGSPTADGKGKDYESAILNHLNQLGYFRRNAPSVFGEKSVQSPTVNEERLKEMKPVPIPPELKQRNEVFAKLAQINKDRRLGLGNSSSNKDLFSIMEKLPKKATSPRVAPDGSALSSNPLDDPGYLNRLKGANYGRWYIKPKKYNTKVNKIDTEIRKIKEMNDD